MLKKRRGLTLIEIIISIAILSIIVVAFLNMFSVSFINIVRAGDRTGTMFEIQKDIEIDLAKIEYEVTDDPIVIDFVGEYEAISPSGNIRSQPVDDVEIWYYKPIN